MTVMQVSGGSSAQLDATVTPDGVNFCVYTKFATRVEFLLFDQENGAVPALAA